MSRNPRHPMQPLVVDETGPTPIIRFKQNKIVQFLLDAGPFDLNSLAMMPFDDEDREQLAQLIGYSVSGFGDLSYARLKTVIEADNAAAAISERLAKKKGKK